MYFQLQSSWNILHFLFQLGPQETRTQKQKQSIKSGLRPQAFELDCQA